MVANAHQPLPPLLALVSASSTRVDLAIPPAPKLTLVPKAAPALDSDAVHRWVLKLRDLWAGDALVLGEYKVCCVASPSFHLQYTIVGLRVLFHEDAQYGERRAQQAVAAWLLRDGKCAADVIAYQKNDADALRLSMITGDHPNAWYIVRISTGTLNGVRRLNRKPRTLHLWSEKPAERVEPVREIVSAPVLVTVSYRQLRLIGE